MIRSWASRRASSAAASAVAWSGYPMAIRSAIVFPSSCHASPHDTSPDGCPPHPRRVKSAAVPLAGECYYARLGRVLERDEPYGSGRSPQRRGSVHSSAYAATALEVPLESKLHAPEPRDGWVERPALAARLAQARAKLVLVDAPVSLWSHVVHALHRARPELCAQPLLEALRARPADIAGVMLPLLVNELNALPGPVILVLDDYHRVKERSCHGQVDYLLSHLPPG